jgi:hypothetical protein
VLESSDSDVDFSAGDGQVFVVHGIVLAVKRCSCRRGKRWLVLPKGRLQQPHLARGLTHSAMVVTCSVSYLSRGREQMVKPAPRSQLAMHVGIL